MYNIKIFKIDIYIYNIYYLKVFLDVAIVDSAPHFEHVPFIRLFLFIYCFFTEFYILKIDFFMWYIYFIDISF